MQMSYASFLRNGILLLAGTVCVLAQPKFSATGTPAANLKIAKDFKVDLLYNVPKDQQGSWVAMCVDPKGRLIVSDQYGKLYRVTLPPVNSVAVILPGRLCAEPFEMIGGFPFLA